MKGMSAGSIPENLLHSNDAAPSLGLREVTPKFNDPYLKGLIRPSAQ
jgi:hypothetical protein